MADPLSVIGAASASVGLGTFAVQSAKALYDLIKSLHSYPNSVKHLQTELYGLVIALERVQNITCDDKVRAELDPILKASHIACLGLRDVINKCTSHSGGRQPNLHDWMRMKFLGGDINEFKETLAGYKSTITIIVTSMSIDLGQMTIHQLAGYQSAIAETKTRLSAQLQNVGQRPPMQQGDQEQIKELEDAILQCIQACRKAGSSIDRVRRESFGEVTRGRKKGIAVRKIQQKTDDDLHYVQSFLSSGEIRLLEIKEQELARQQQQQQQLDERSCWLNHCRSILEKRQEEAQQEKAHRFENISSKDQSLQIITSTTQNTLSAKNVNAETQSSQIMGDCPSGTVEKIIENHSSHWKERPSGPSRKRFIFFGRTSKKAPGQS